MNERSPPRKYFELTDKDLSKPNVPCARHQFHVAQWPSEWFHNNGSNNQLQYKQAENRKPCT